jgi:tRNA(adenine34) deaminase
LTDATIYVTKEPCPMCAGAMVLARVKRCVFGATDPKSGGAGSVHDLLRASGLNHRVEILGGVMQPQARALLKDFFAAQRREE